MNTTKYAQGMSSVNFDKWLLTTILSVAISGFVALLVGSGSPSWSTSIAAVVLWLTTSFFSSWAQIVVIKSAIPIRISRWLLYLLFGSIVGWTVSFLLVYLLAQPMEFLINSAELGSAVWIGFFAGGIIGLFPGIFIGLAYWWLIQPDDNAKRLFVSNVIGWCVGMGLASAGILLLLTIVVSNMVGIF